VTPGNIILWHRSFSIDGGEIDQQHRNLIRIINDISNSRSDGRTAAQDALIEELKQYAVAHFEFEDHLQARIGFPGLQGHARLHAAFVQGLLQLERRRTSILFINDLLMMLSNWLVHHILIEDMAMRPYISAYLESLKNGDEEHTGTPGPTWQ